MKEIYSARRSITSQINNIITTITTITIILQCLFVQTNGQLYEFSSFTFTSAKMLGALGPTYAQLMNVYTAEWTKNETFFTIDPDFPTGGIQLWTVPLTATYRITAAGAPGGGVGAGPGAILGGTFNLTQGQQLRILVGQRGDLGMGASNSFNSGGGGGGTFVVAKNTNACSGPSCSTILIIAGGGGGGNGDYTAGWTAVNPVGGAASLSTSGVSTFNFSESTTTALINSPVKLLIC